MPVFFFSVSTTVDLTRVSNPSSATTSSVERLLVVMSAMMASRLRSETSNSGPPYSRLSDFGFNHPDALRQYGEEEDRLEMRRCLSFRWSGRAVIAALNS